MSKQFKVGDRLRFHGVFAGKALEPGNAGFDRVGKLASVVHPSEPGHTTVWVRFDGDPSKENWFPERFELVQREFKVGDVLIPAAGGIGERLRNLCERAGFDPARMVVRSLDFRGWPILTWESADETLGCNPDIFESAPPIANTYYRIQAGALTFTTHHADAAAAKEWLQENGDVGATYTIQEVRDVATYSVTRELKETA
ncbi:hypothetical protein [Pararobbsia alpina]|uniref:Uncharacterized protein n=1 Tax=Pararobbsia alpina TaxID=621374 RepID=A0A6S7D4A1_9BURK|nr:hypothetical protein [Pararobbsia alpina]CAB3795574.1 hypothetical protein LMG28138_03907 [Pararobbsia alpina]